MTSGLFVFAALRKMGIKLRIMWGKMNLVANENARGCRRFDAGEMGEKDPCALVSCRERAG